ncbi:ChaC-like protein-domain-containing protein [Chaetomidium leptoderma]|uniref:glutathione-specific gamma-glutamylcyclotransferase n=1 Tax=Chaetomidium leptoderma TaxID=669021 RepID=A0AAN6VUQ6_9PEZI|nr:ChaC-like protein-domain-containing protein [Chaetomidium leptoderma]
MSVEGPAAPADEFWLFGYGSLIWKPPPHFDRRIPGWVTGYVRRFWQVRNSPSLSSLLNTTNIPPPTPPNSQDHRGTPDAPGRVVTLISRSYWEQLTDHHDSAPDRVWGVAYRIQPDRVAEVKEYLDIREINGYTIHYTPFHPAAPHHHHLDHLDHLDLDHHHRGQQQQQPIQTLVYIGTPDNDQFMGPQDPQQLAEHIYRSEGPSGLNRDYLWGLEAALAELSSRRESGDAHVTDLSDRVRAVAAEEREQRRRRRRSNGTDGGREEIMRSPAAAPPPVNAVSSSEHVLQREQQHHEQHHDFRKVSSIDEQEETEKTS